MDENLNETITRTEQETMDFARKLAKAASFGDIFCLTGDLGAGKTVFAKGFALGLNISEEITSPTFTIVNEYTEGITPFFHFDCYRLAGSRHAFCFEFEEYFESDGICLIEWPQNIKSVIPDRAFYIDIKRISDNIRKITLNNCTKLIKTGDFNDFSY